MKVFEIFSSYSGAKVSKHLAKLLKSNCLNHLKLMASGKAPLLLRGMESVALNNDDGDFQYVVFGERTEERRSKTDNSIFLSWTTLSPDWKNVPNRLFSVPCTTNLESAKSFGQEYIIIPFDSVETFAYTPEDFNYTEVDDGQQLLDLLSVIEDIHRFLRRGGPDFLEDHLDHDVFNKSVKALWSLDDIKEFSSIVHKLKIYPTDEDFESLMLSVETLYEMTGDLSIYDFFNQQLTPRKMNIQVGNLASLKVKNKDPEIWFRGPFIAIKPGPYAIADTPKVLLKSL